MIEKILCFLVLIICLVYGLALLSWLVMKLDIEKRRSKRTKFFERMGENLMEIEKLIKHMREEAQDYRSGRTLGRAFVDAEDVLDEAATALEQLQAENDRLRRERDDAIRQLKFFAPCAGCKWYRGIKGCAHELGCDTNHDYYEFVAKEE